MWPRINQAEKLRIKQATRSREIHLAMECIDRSLRARAETNGKIKVLEIGSGDGTQCRHLTRFGKVTATDRFLNPDLKLPIKDVTFTICDSRALPLPDGGYELIYANHVIEHIPNLPEALAEMKRVGQPGCVYAFSVPTSLWLLLSVPGQYWDKLLHVAQRLTRHFKEDNHVGTSAAPWHQEGTARAGSLSGFKKLLPTGHGEYPRFSQCLWSFRSRRWRRLFASCGLKLLREEPLLLYAPSRWPIVPASRWPAKLGLCSSRLYLLVADPHR